MKQRRGGDRTAAPGVQRVLSSKPSRRGSQAEILICDNEFGAPTGALLADLIEEVGTGWYQFLALPTLFGITMIECGQIQVISGIAVGLKLEWHLSDVQKAMLPSLAFCGLAIGTFISGILSDAVGRKKTILTGYITTAITGMALALAFNFLSMACLVCLNGIACGIGVTAVMVMITEICPSSTRAVAFVFPLFAQSIGEMFAVGMVDIFMPDLMHGNWRAVTCCVALPGYLMLVMSCFFLRESPYWLVANGRVLEARTEIIRIARMNGTLDKVEFLTDALEPIMSGTTSASKSDSGSELRKCLSSIQFIFMTCGFCFLCFMGQLLTFGMSYFWPEMLQYFTNQSSYFSPATSLGLIRSFGIPSALLMIPVMRSQWGHRWVIFLAAILEAGVLYGCMFALALSNDIGPEVVLFGGFSLAFAQLFYFTSLIFMTESFPTTVRAIMSSLCVTFGRMGALLGPYLVEVLRFQGFLALAGSLSLCAIPFMIMMKETKGRQLEDFFDEEPHAAKKASGAQNCHEDDTLEEGAPLLEQSTNSDDSCSESAAESAAGSKGDTGGSG